MSKDYDAIVIGARCAGSPTAMLLARRGYRVLLLDRATFPSDTISTHLIHPPGVAALERWGLLDRLEATGCPPITTYAYDFGPITISGSPRPVDGIARAFCPRRIVLDQLLVEAAAAAGAELREGFTVEELVIEDGRVTGVRGHSKRGATVTERARVVIGADGKRSAVVEAVQPDCYLDRGTFMAQYYAYWSDLPTDGIKTYVRPEYARGWAAIPTHDDLTVVPFGWPRSEFTANRTDIEGNFLEAIELAPEFAERLREATRETRFFGAGDIPNLFRKPYGPGWALVGDAGYHKDPITAYGISDAFRDAEALAAALEDAFDGGRAYEEALSEYQQARDTRSRPYFELTCEFARLEPPPPELQQLLGAAYGNQDAMDDFVSVMAATLEPAEFFGPENAARLLAHAEAPAPVSAVISSHPGAPSLNELLTGDARAVNSTPIRSVICASSFSQPAG
jgi:flavin-dependent dehydrogenase